MDRLRVSQLDAPRGASGRCSAHGYSGCGHLHIALVARSRTVCGETMGRLCVVHVARVCGGHCVGAHFFRRLVLYASVSVSAPAATRGLVRRCLLSCLLLFFSLSRSLNLSLSLARALSPSFSLRAIVKSEFPLSAVTVPQVARIAKNQCVDFIHCFSRLHFCLESVHSISFQIALSLCSRQHVQGAPAFRRHSAVALGFDFLLLSHRYSSTCKLDVVFACVCFVA